MAAVVQAESAGEVATSNEAKPVLAASSKATTAAVITTPPTRDVDLVTRDDVLTELSVLLASSASTEAPRLLEPPALVKEN